MPTLVHSNDYDHHFYFSIEVEREREIEIEIEADVGLKLYFPSLLVYCHWQREGERGHLSGTREIYIN